jgi:hypothetical protein
MYKEIFKAAEIDSYASGWIVDLSPANVINPDCYWRFRTRKEATAFAALLDIGYEAVHAAHLVQQAKETPSGYPRSKSEAAAALGSITSEAKATASRENGKLGGRPKKSQ